jgi:hypothetical protein
MFNLGAGFTYLNVFLSLFTASDHAAVFICKNVGTCITQ